MTRTALAAILTVASLTAQDQAPRPIFRAGVEIVVLDVGVVDGDGRPIRDLRPEDFAVTLDKRAGKIVTRQDRTSDRVTAVSTSSS